MCNDINLAYSEYKSNRNKENYEAVVISGEGIVRHFAAAYGGGLNFDDLYQTGMIGLIKAVNSYDDGSGIAFSTWASSCVIGEIRHYARKERAYSKPDSFEIHDSKDVSGELLPLEEELARDQKAELSIDERITLEQAIDSLDEPHKKVLKSLFYYGLTQQQTADSMGMTQKNVSRTKISAIEKLRLMLLDTPNFKLVDNEKSFKLIKGK